MRERQDNSRTDGDTEAASGISRTGRLATWLAVAAIIVLLVPQAAIVLMAWDEALGAAALRIALTAVVALLPVGVLLWLFFWLRADKLQKISTGNLLFLWIVGSIGLSILLRLLGVPQPPIEVAGSVAAITFVVLALLQYYLRRRWKETKSRGAA